MSSSVTIKFRNPEVGIMARKKFLCETWVEEAYHCPHCGVAPTYTDNKDECESGTCYLCLACDTEFYLTSVVNPGETGRCRIDAIKAALAFAASQRGVGMSAISSDVFDGYVDEAANALRHITPYEAEEARAIVLAIANYSPMRKIASLLKYAGAPCHESFKGVSTEGASWAMEETLCSTCGQLPSSMPTGEYPCPTCGLLRLHDEAPQP